MRWAMLLAVVLVGCGPELPAICDMPGDRPVVTHGRHIEVCGECGGECVRMCARYCDEGGNIEASEALEVGPGQYECGFVDGVPVEQFCGRWVDD